MQVGASGLRRGQPALPGPGLCPACRRATGCEPLMKRVRGCRQAFPLEGVGLGLYVRVPEFAVSLWTRAVCSEAWKQGALAGGGDRGDL